MDQQRRALQAGLCAIACAVLLRLWDGALQLPGRAEEPAGQAAFWEYESPPPVFPPELPAFAAEDAALVEFTGSAPEQPDPESLLLQPLGLNLRQDGPTVLILHTHATESYTRAGEQYEAYADYRTLDEQYNMLRIGDEVAQLLEAGGIGVLHDRTLYDYPDYSSAYSRTRKAVQSALEQAPQLCLVLDLHRDAAGSGNRQLRTQASIDGQPGAQLMLVMGTGSAGLKHPEWQQNLSLAVKLQVLLEKQYPGIMRPIALRSQRFNQDLCAGSLLVEVGAAGNTRHEALLAARALAQAILALAELKE